MGRKAIPAPSITASQQEISQVAVDPLTSKLVHGNQSLSREQLGRPTIRPNFPELKIHRSPFAAWKSMVLLLIVGRLIVAFSQEFTELTFVTSFLLFSFESSFSFPVLTLLMLPIVFRIFSTIYGSCLILRADKLIYIDGQMSTKRRYTDVSYPTLLFVQVEQGLIERIMNVGTVLLGRHANESSELVLKGLPKPEKIASLIKRRVDFGKR